MKRFLLTVLVLASCGLADVSAQNNDDAAKQQIAGRLSELSQLRQRVERAAEKGRVMIVLVPKDVDVAQGFMFAKRLEESFNGDVMHRDAVAYIKGNIDGAIANKAIQRFSSPLAAKMMRLEVEALKFEHRDKFPAYIRSLNMQEPSVRKRLYLIDRLNLATGASEYWIKMESGLATFAIDSIARLRPPDKRPSKADKERMIAQALKKAAGASDYYVMFLLYAFRAVPDSELEQYVQMCETDEGTWFSEITRIAVTEASANAVARVTEKLSKYD